MDCHTAEEFLSFLKLLDKETDKTKVLHVIVDNYPAHKTKKVIEYVEKSNGRIVRHFTPTHSSWLNLVERWFAQITTKRMRRKSWTSVRELEKWIMDFIGNWNKTGKKYVWTKTASQIKTSINEAKERYDHYLKTYKMSNNIILLMRYPILLHCVVKKFLALYFWNRFR